MAIHYTPRIQLQRQAMDPLDEYDFKLNTVEDGWRKHLAEMEGPNAQPSMMDQNGQRYPIEYRKIAKEPEPSTFQDRIAAIQNDAAPLRERFNGILTGLTREEAAEWTRNRYRNPNETVVQQDPAELGLKYDPEKLRQAYNFNDQELADFMARKDIRQEQIQNFKDRGILVPNQPEQSPVQEQVQSAPQPSYQPAYEAPQTPSIREQVLGSDYGNDNPRRYENIEKVRANSSTGSYDPAERLARMSRGNAPEPAPQPTKKTSWLDRPIIESIANLFSGGDDDRFNQQVANAKRGRDRYTSMGGYE